MGTAAASGDRLVGTFINGATCNTIANLLNAGNWGPGFTYYCDGRLLKAREQTRQEQLEMIMV
jgi:hypothetical protein